MNKYFSYDLYVFANIEQKMDDLRQASRKLL